MIKGHYRLYFLECSQKLETKGCMELNFHFLLTFFVVSCLVDTFRISPRIYLGKMCAYRKCKIFQISEMFFSLSFAVSHVSDLSVKPNAHCSFTFLVNTHCAILNSPHPVILSSSIGHIALCLKTVTAGDRYTLWFYSLLV